MMNLSSLSKVFIFSVVVMLLDIIGLIAVFSGVSEYIIISLFGVIAVLMAFNLHQTYKARVIQEEIITVLSSFSKGDLDTRIILSSEKGNTAALIWSVNNTLDSIDAFVRESSATIQAAGAGEFYRKIILTGMQGSFRRAADAINHGVDDVRGGLIDFMHKSADELESMVKTASDTMSASVQELGMTAVELTSLAQNGSQQAETLLVTTESASKQAKVVIVAIEQVTQSATEAEEKIMQCEVTTQEAVHKVESAVKHIAELSVCAEKIGGVSNIINDIAEKINLLALNATIEAARAGEAGKGFEVVAHEVKQLATQTGGATAEISDLIGATQKQTEATTQVISEISNTMLLMKDIVSEVSGTMHEQELAAGKIDDSIRSMAVETDATGRTAQDVSVASESTGDAAEKVRQVTAVVAEQSQALNDAVQGCLVKIRANQVT